MRQSSHNSASLTQLVHWDREAPDAR